jgi:hypothetical protein
MEFRRHRTQRVAAAQSELSERTGRRIERDPRLPSQKSAERPLRRQTADPLDGLWESDILPLLLASPGLRPVTLLDEMRLRRPDRDWDRLRRTLERRVRVWRAEHGPQREVIFRQDHPPGQQGLSDFTDMGEIEVRVGGERVVHRLYHFVLAYSGWEHAEVVLGGDCERLQLPNGHRVASEFFSVSIAVLRKTLTSIYHKRILSTSSCVSRSFVRS